MGDVWLVGMDGKVYEFTSGEPLQQLPERPSWWSNINDIEFRQLQALFVTYPQAKDLMQRTITRYEAELERLKKEATEANNKLLRFRELAEEMFEFYNEGSW